jgi:hypothetical protein
MMAAMETPRKKIRTLDDPESAPRNGVACGIGDIFDATAKAGATTLPDPELAGKKV